MNSESNSQLNPPQFSPKSGRALLFGTTFLFINGFFVAKVPQATRPELAGVSAAFVLVLWFPGAFATLKWLGWKRAVMLLVGLGSFAVAIETFALKTGLPYGNFSYGDKIGTKFFGLVPWTVPFSYPPLVLGAFALAARIAPKRQLFAPTLVLLLFDAVLDPGAVQQKFWTYEGGGLYYSVPFSNFCGWVVSGFIANWIFASVSEHKSVPLPLISSVTLILAFWTSVTLFTGLWLPALIGFALLGWVWHQVRSSVQASVSTEVLNSQSQTLEVL